MSGLDALRWAFGSQMQSVQMIAEPQAICHLDFSTRFVSPSTTTKDGSPNFFHHGMDRSLRSGRDIGRSRFRVLPLKHCGLDAL